MQCTMWFKVPDPRSILVFRNGSIGNTLAAVPALHALRDSFPATQITVVLDSLGRDLLQHCPYFDRVIVYNKRGNDEGLNGFLRVTKDLRHAEPDWAILLKRFFRNGLLARLSGARRRIGFQTDGRAPFLTESIPYDEGVTVAELNLRLIASTGAPASVSVLPEVFFGDDEHAAFATWRSESGLDSDYDVIHFGGITGGAGFLTMENRAALVRACVAARKGIVIGRGERETAEAYELQKVLPHLRIATGIPLRLTMLLIAHAQRFIGTNSGPMHLAAASRVPGIALFHHDARFAAEAVKWRPLFDGLKIVPVAIEDDTKSLIERATQAWPGGSQ